MYTIQRQRHRQMEPPPIMVHLHMVNNSLHSTIMPQHNLIMPPHSSISISAIISIVLIISIIHYQARMFTDYQPQLMANRHRLRRCYKRHAHLKHMRTVQNLLHLARDNIYKDLMIRTMIRWTRMNYFLWMTTVHLLQSMKAPSLEIE